MKSIKIASLLCILSALCFTGTASAFVISPKPVTSATVNKPLLDDGSCDIYSDTYDHETCMRSKDRCVSGQICPP